MDLLSIYERKEKRKNLKDELAKEESLKDLLRAIVDSSETCIITSKDLCEDLHVRYKLKSHNAYESRGWTTVEIKKVLGYEIKINKALVKKVEKYINEH